MRRIDDVDSSTLLRPEAKLSAICQRIHLTTATLRDSPALEVDWHPAKPS